MIGAKASRVRLRRRSLTLPGGAVTQEFSM
jgi:hypothetical protein